MRARGKSRARRNLAAAVSGTASSRAGWTPRSLKRSFSCSRHPGTAAEYHREAAEEVTAQGTMPAYAGSPSSRSIHAFSCLAACVATVCLVARLHAIQCGWSAPQYCTQPVWPGVPVGTHDFTSWDTCRRIRSLQCRRSACYPTLGTQASAAASCWLHCDAPRSVLLVDCLPRRQPLASRG